MKYTLLLLFQLAGLLLFAQPVRLSGQLHPGNTIKTFRLFRFDNPPLDVAIPANQTITIHSDSLATGFYETNLVGLLYLKPGFRLRFKPEGKNGYRFSGEGAMENNSLRDARQQLSRYIPAAPNGSLQQEALLMEPTRFLSGIDSFLLAGKQVLEQSPDSFFVRLALLDLELFARKVMTSYIGSAGMDQKKQNLAMDALNRMNPDPGRYLRVMDSLNRTARIKKVSFADLQPVAQRANKPIDRNDSLAFANLPAYREAIEKLLIMAKTGQLMKYKPPYTPEHLALATQKAVEKEIRNAFIRQYLDYENTRDLLRAAKDSATINEYFTAYLSRNPRPHHLKAVTTTYERSLATANNRPAPDFNFSDVAGKKHTLSGMQGQYVYIDVWATWCTPCLKEIPELKKLVSDYAGKNIRFVSISVDLPEDKARWKGFVKARQLAGLQLIADKAFQSAFIDAFQISAIPRFLLIGPDGRILSGDAPRPSDKALRQQLDSLAL